MQEGAPLLVYTQRVRDLLQDSFDFSVEIAMRYRQPGTAEVIARMKKEGVDDLFILPMYPHYAMSSFETAVVHVYEELRKQKGGKTTAGLLLFRK